VQHATIPGLSYRGPDGALNVDELPLGMFPLAFRRSPSGPVRNAGDNPLHPDSQDRERGDHPEGKLLSLGVRHNLSQWFGVLPLDLSVSYFYSTFKTGDLIDFKGNQIGVQAEEVLRCGVYGAWRGSRAR